MTTKVLNTVSHKTSQGDCRVTKGKLILLEVNNIPFQEGQLLKRVNFSTPKTKIGDYAICGNSSTIDPDWQVIQPLIICENEPLEVGDNFFWNNMIMTWVENDRNVWNTGLLPPKAIATYKLFSSKHLKAIVDGKLKDLQEVLVELISWTDKPKEIHSTMGESNWGVQYVNRVKLTQIAKGYIILHRVENISVSVSQLDTLVTKYSTWLENMKENRRLEWEKTPDTENYLIDQMISHTAETVRDLIALKN